MITRYDHVPVHEMGLDIPAPVRVFPLTLSCRMRSAGSPRASVTSGLAAKPVWQQAILFQTTYVASVFKRMEQGHGQLYGREGRPHARGRHLWTETHNPKK